MKKIRGKKVYILANEVNSKDKFDILAIFFAIFALIQEVEDEMVGFFLVFLRIIRAIKTPQFTTGRDIWGIIDW